MNTLPSLGVTKPPRIDSSVVLPEPDGPEQDRVAARLDAQRDVLQHRELPEAVRDVADIDQGRGHAGFLRKQRQFEQHHQHDGDDEDQRADRVGLRD